jgi:hypothetical protein
MINSAPQLTIEQDPGARRGQHHGNPVCPPPPKSHMLQHLKQEIPCNIVKSLCNIYFQHETWHFRGMNRLAGKLDPSDIVM